MKQGVVAGLALVAGWPVPCLQEFALTCFQITNSLLGHPVGSVVVWRCSWWLLSTAFGLSLGYLSLACQSSEISSWLSCVQATGADPGEEGVFICC
eukprot:scaffold113196_cov22-Tisochrysis_lutea.AAC.3